MSIIIKVTKKKAIWSLAVFLGEIQGGIAEQNIINVHSILIKCADSLHGR